MNIFYVHLLTETEMTVLVSSITLKVTPYLDSICNRILISRKFFPFIFHCAKEDRKSLFVLSIQLLATLSEWDEADQNHNGITTLLKLHMYTDVSPSQFWCLFLFKSGRKHAE